MCHNGLNLLRPFTGCLGTIVPWAWVWQGHSFVCVVKLRPPMGQACGPAREVTLPSHGLYLTEVTYITPHSIMHTTYHTGPSTHDPTQDQNETRVRCVTCRGVRIKRQGPWKQVCFIQERCPSFPCSFSFWRTEADGLFHVQQKHQEMLYGCGSAPQSKVWGSPERQKVAQPLYGVREEHSQDGEWFRSCFTKE